MKKINVFLDDIRIPPYLSSKGIFFENYDDFVICRNYNQFVDFIDSNLENISFVSFDHDIASYNEMGDELTGCDAARYLTNICMYKGVLFPDWFIHSDNNVGILNIKSEILTYLKYVENKELKDFYYYKGMLGGKLI